MQSTVESARSARENLAGALTVLLAPALTPVFTRIAPSVARATAHLFALERHGDAALGAHAGAARDAVRSALADVQAAGIDSPEVDDAMASIAGALGLSHQLASRVAAPGGTTVSPPAPVAGPASPAAAPARPAAAVAVPAVNVAAPVAAPVRFSSPISVGAATDPAPPVAPGADAMMATQLAPSSPPSSSPAPHQVAAAASRTAPKPDDPFFSTQVSRTGRSIAAHPPTAPEAPPLSAPPVAPAPAAHTAPVTHTAAAPSTAAAQPAPLAATAMAVSAPVPTVGSLHIPEQIPAAGTADRVGRKDSHRAALPEKGPAAGALHLEASLGAHSPTNFYKGLSGNDVIDDGGLFIATYQIPTIGTPLWITVSLPGGYEFQAGGVVRWTRSTGSGDSPPGFGAALEDLSKEARQLVYRYVRNREPLFHDDL